MISFLIKVTLHSHIELILDLWSDLGDGLLLEQGEQVPGLVERVEDCAILVVALVDELLLESVMEQQEESVVII